MAQTSVCDLIAGNPRLKVWATVRWPRYTYAMARGWESKSVEDQIGAAEAERELQARHQLTAEQREASEHQQSLLLSRSLLRSRLKAARDSRYRAQLQTALDEIESQLRESES